MMPSATAPVSAPTSASTPIAATASLNAPPETLTRRRRMLGWLIAVLAAGGLIAMTAVAVSLARGDTMTEALRSTSLLQVHRLRLQGGMDSWGPMWSSFTRMNERGVGGSAPLAGSPYELALRLDSCKFQYPPSSWLLLEAMPRPRGMPLSCIGGGASGTDIHSAPWSAKPWIAAASALACLVLVGLFGLALLREPGPNTTIGGPSRAQMQPQPPQPPQPSRLRTPLLLAAALTGLCFYPMVRGHTLGQLQVFINLALAAALMLWPVWPRTCGLLVGMCCLFKPQYVLFLIWGLLRRRWGFAAGLAAVVACGHGLALALYGFDVHLQYLQLLQGLSQVGEAYWPNQSVNGLLNRLLQTADAATWSPTAFPAYHPLVRWATLASSVALIGAALWPGSWPISGSMRWPRHGLTDRAQTSTGPAAQLDFGAMLAAVTIASPIAWEHHYGSFLPLFALLLVVLAAQPAWPRRSALLLGIAFVLMANAVLRPEWIFVHPLAGLAGSHLWLGAMGVFGLLLVWRGRLTTVHKAAAAGAAP